MEKIVKKQQKVDRSEGKRGQSKVKKDREAPSNLEEEFAKNENKKERKFDLKEKREEEKHLAKMQKIKDQIAKEERKA